MWEILASKLIGSNTGAAAAPVKALSIDTTKSDAADTQTYLIGGLLFAGALFTLYLIMKSK